MLCLIHYKRCFILAVIFHIICGTYFFMCGNYKFIIRGASFRYTHGASLSFDLKRGQRHKEAWDRHFEGLPKIWNPESGIRNLRSEILKPRMTSQQTKKRISLERIFFSRKFDV